MFAGLLSKSILTRPLRFDDTLVEIRSRASDGGACASPTQTDEQKCYYQTEK